MMLFLFYFFYCSIASAIIFYSADGIFLKRFLQLAKEEFYGLLYKNPTLLKK